MRQIVSAICSQSDEKGIYLSFVYTSAPLTRCAIRMRRAVKLFSVNLRRGGDTQCMEAHLVLFVFAQKTNKFQFAVNGMRTVRGWRSAGS